MDENSEVKSILEAVGRNNRYQFITLFLFFSIFICAQFFIISLPFLEMKPYVNVIYNNKEKTQMYLKLNYTICSQRDEGLLKFTIDQTKNPESSLVLDLGIYCDQTNTSFIAISLFSGLIIGACSSYLLSNYFGRKQTIIIIYPLYIASLLGFILLPNEKVISFIMLFVIGIFAYILIICIITYMCELIKQAYIPIYLTLMVSGLPLGGLFYDILFEVFSKLGWRYILLIVGGISIVCYIAVLFYLIESPIYHYHTEQKQKFRDGLLLLAKKNNKELEEKSKLFLKSYCMPNAQLLPEKEDDKEENLLKKEYNSLVTFERYSFIDLLRYTSQITNFFILSFLWVTGTIILHGLNIHSKEFTTPQDASFYRISAVSYCIDFVSNFILLLFIIFKRFNEYTFLISLQLLSFILLMISLLFEIDHSPYSAFSITLILSKMCWNSAETIFYIITVQIYPLTLRAIGLGWNKGLGKLGGILGPLLIEHSVDKQFIIYYIVLIGFGIVFTFVLPEKMKIVNTVPEKDNNNNETSKQGKTYYDDEEEKLSFRVNDSSLKRIDAKDELIS